jgi:hypothetical protein
MAEMKDSLWGDEEKETETKNPFPPENRSAHPMRKFTLITIGILLVAGGAAYYYFFLRTPQPNVALEFSKPDQVQMGEPFTLMVSYSNYSDKILTDARLSVMLPDGLAFLGSSGDERTRDASIGDLGPGSINKQTFDLIATNGSQSLKTVTASILYGIGSDSNAQFETKKTVDVAVGQPAISLNFTTPQNVFSGENFDIGIGYQNNSQTDFKNLRLHIDYPPIYQFQRATLNPTTGNNDWDIGTLGKNENGTLTISGSVIGAVQSFFGFNVSLLGDFNGQTYTLNSQTANLSVSLSPLSITSELREGENYIAHPGDMLHYILSYKNNSSVALKDVKITTTLVGDMFDFSSVRSNGFFNSITNTLTWTVANTPQLQGINPGDTGTVEVDVNLKGAYPISRISDKNFSLKLHSQIESPTVPPDVSATKTVSIADKETKVQGFLTVQAQGFFFDAASGILNSGPYPPKVNQATNYTIHWKITNYATDVSAVHLSTFLQSGSVFTGKIKSNTDTAPVYNSATGEVTWDIANIPATRGVVGVPLEAVFQVKATPAVNQVGQDIPLISETRIQGQDMFVSLPLSNISPPVTTALPDDTRITATDRRVK